MYVPIDNLEPFIASARQILNSENKYHQNRGLADGLVRQPELRKTSPSSVLFHIVDTWSRRAYDQHILLVYI